MQSPIAVLAFKRITNARLRHDDAGQDLLEYGLLIALIALVAFSAVGVMGNTVYTLFWDNIANNF